jgi:MoxR-like ATPase
MDQLYSSLGSGLHTILVGPRGTGKTTAVRRAARELGRPLFAVQGHSDLSIEDLRGCPGLKDGSSTFIPGPVVRAVREGGLLLFDEVNLVRPGVVAWLNNVLDTEGLLSVPETGEAVSVHPQFLACFCYNEGYAGTREPNEAFKDRCRVIFCDYWPKERELHLLRAVLPGVAGIDARRMIEVAHAVRGARRNGAVDFDFSIRTLRQWGLDAYERTMDLLESFKAVVLPKVGDPLLHGPQHEALVKIAELTLSRTSF